MSQKLIDAKAKAFAEARDVLEQSQNDLRKILRDATAEMLPSVRKQAEKVMKLQADLTELVEANPDLFPEGAKTQIIYEIKVGFQKQQDSIEVADEAEVIAAIRANLKAKASLLIEKKETVSKAVLKKLTDAELALIGLEREEGTDAVIVKPATADIDKLVKLLVPEAV